MFGGPFSVTFDGFRRRGGYGFCSSSSPVIVYGGSRFAGESFVIFRFGRDKFMLSIVSPVYVSN